MSESNACIVMTTYRDDDNGQQLIDALLNSRLAACIQVVPIQSHYVWEGRITHDAEKLLLVKTKPSLYKRVEETIVKTHAYETPEVLRVGVDGGLSKYFAWLDEVCDD